MRNIKAKSRLMAFTTPGWRTLTATSVPTRAAHIADSNAPGNGTMLGTLQKRLTATVDCFSCAVLMMEPTRTFGRFWAVCQMWDGCRELAKLQQGSAGMHSACAASSCHLQHESLSKQQKYGAGSKGFQDELACREFEHLLKG